MAVRLRDCLWPAAVALASCDGAEIMIAPYRGGHAVGAVSWPRSAPSSDLSAASQVLAVRQIGDAYDAEPMASSSSMRHHRRSRRPGQVLTTPSQWCHFAAVSAVGLSAAHLIPRQPTVGSSSLITFGSGQLDAHRGGVRLARGVGGWLRFRAWSCSSALPIGGVSSCSSR
jgi:hypothetical protein